MSNIAFATENLNDKNEWGKAIFVGSSGLMPIGFTKDYRIICLPSSNTNVRSKHKPCILILDSKKKEMLRIEFEGVIESAVVSENEEHIIISRRKSSSYYIGIYDYMSGKSVKEFQVKQRYANLLDSIITKDEQPGSYTVTADGNVYRLNKKNDGYHLNLLDFPIPILLDWLKTAKKDQAKLKTNISDSEKHKIEKKIRKFTNVIKAYSVKDGLVYSKGKGQLIYYSFLTGSSKLMKNKRITQFVVSHKKDIVYVVDIKTKNTSLLKAINYHNGRVLWSNENDNPPMKVKAILSPKEDYLVLVEETVSFINSISGHLAHSFEASEGAFRSTHTVFSQDGAMLATGGTKHDLVVWNTFPISNLNNNYKITKGNSKFPFRFEKAKIEVSPLTSFIAKKIVKSTTEMMNSQQHPNSPVSSTGNPIEKKEKIESKPWHIDGDNRIFKNGKEVAQINFSFGRWRINCATWGRRLHGDSDYHEYNSKEDVIHTALRWCEP